MSDQQPAPPIYNTPRFRVSDYNFEMFVGPRAGDDFKDFTLTDLASGAAVKLSDFAGERLGPHKKFDDKIKAAKLVGPRYAEHRRVLVDNFEGDFHRAYGAMPNVLYIIRPDGKIHYRCNWATPAAVRGALRDRARFHTLENADTLSLRAGRKKMHMIRTMWTGGGIALYDFFRGMPLTLARHYKTDTFYKKHGRFINDPADKPSAQELAEIINEAAVRAEAAGKKQSAKQAAE